MVKENIPLRLLIRPTPRFRAGKRGPASFPLGLDHPSFRKRHLQRHPSESQPDVATGLRDSAGCSGSGASWRIPRFQKGDEAAAQESIAGSEHVDLSGESAPWLQHDSVGNVHAESEWRDVPRPKKVDDSFAVPFRWICKISILKNGKYDGGGSGVLISDRHVLTAAHVINDVLRDPVQYDLEVTMAMDGNKNLGSTVRSGRPWVPALTILQERAGATTTMPSSLSATRLDRANLQN